MNWLGRPQGATVRKSMLGLAGRSLREGQHADADENTFSENIIGL